jgi:hypothetical protein
MRPNVFGLTGCKLESALDVMSENNQGWPRFKGVIVKKEGIAWSGCPMIIRLQATPAMGLGKITQRISKKII